MQTTCIPGSSHGGMALRPPSALHSDPAYDQNDTVSLLGGSGGEINYLITLNSFVALIYVLMRAGNGNWLIRKNVTSGKTLGTLQ